MPRIEFEADTAVELADMVRWWLTGAKQVAAPAQAGGDPSEQVQAVLHWVRGADSRRLLRELAERAVRGEPPLVLNADLRQRYAKTSGTAFAGMVGGPNKLMRRLAGRDLILRDPGGGYRLEPADAAVVVATWPSGGAGPADR